MGSFKLRVSLTCMAVLGVTTAFAANPFSDVTPDSWAYQAVDQLATAGIINGYPDGTFKGQKDIIRFEMAQMIAKGLANQNRANAEQQAMLNRLSDEFSNELSNLGIRVNHLEDRVGNVQITGDARIAYARKEGIGNQDSKDKFTSRARLGIKARVNKNTTVKARITSGSIEFGNSKKDAQASFDRIYVEHKLNKNVTLDMGRFDQDFGNGLIYGSQFDGASVTATSGKWTINGAYGYMTAGRFKKADKEKNGEAGVVNVSVNPNKNFVLGAMYARTGSANVKMANGKKNNEFRNIYGVNGSYTMGKLTLAGEWVKASGLSDSDVWTLGAGWGKYKIDKANSWRVRLNYFDQSKNAPVFKALKYESNDLMKRSNEGYKAWQISGDYALEKNIGINMLYGFHVRTHEDNKVNNYYRANLNFKF